MELDWSEQSPHIRSLFHPWQPGDGYDEAAIVAAEARLGVRLPTTLRNFYLAWGKRKDISLRSHPLLSPDELMFRDNALYFGLRIRQSSCGVCGVSGWRKLILPS